MYVEKRIWDDFITERDRAVYGAGFGGRVGIGKKPSLIVIDVLNKNLGDASLPTLEAVKRYGPACCGEEGWRAVSVIREIVDYCHDRGIPVVYVMPAPPEQMSDEKKKRFAAKMPGMGVPYQGAKNGDALPDLLTPTDADYRIYKPTNSAFFNTNLHQLLQELGVDTVLMTGNSTSGCIRAGVLDAFAYGYFIQVVEDAVYDRGQASHAINLFDMNAKYGDVVPWRELKALLSDALTASATR